MRGSGETKDLGNELNAVRTLAADSMRCVTFPVMTSHRCGNSTQMSTKCVIDDNQSCGQRAASGG